MTEEGALDHLANPPEFSISDELITSRRKLRSFLGSGGLDLARLAPRSRSSAFWKRSVAIAHRHFGFGDGQTVGIIDSGFASEFAEPLRIDVGRSASFTGPSMDDRLGHGTCVSALVNAVAPQASQVHAKIIDSRSASFDQIMDRLQKAFGHLETVKVDIVNISMNCITTLDSYTQDVRPGFFCYCPICAILTDFVRRTGATVFVSEGNIRNRMRPQGAWSCPTAAPYATPVFAYGASGRLYDTNVPLAYGVLAPGEMAVIPHRKTIAHGLAARLGRHRPEAIVGSSYAAPLAAGTLAAARSLLLRLGYARPCVPLRNQEEDDRDPAARHDFPLENLFFSPAEREADLGGFDRQSAWFLSHQYAFEAANKQLADGKREDAGLLCCIFACWIKHAICDNPDQSRSATTYAYAMDLFLNGIRTLLETELAITCDEYLQQAEELCRDARSKGLVPGGEDHLQELRRWFRANRVALMFRLGTGAS